MRGVLRQKPQREDLDPAQQQRRDERDALAKKEAIYDSGILSRGVKIDAGKLSMAEVAELLSLDEKARRDPDGSYLRGDLEALSAKERRRFNQLLDQGLPDFWREKRRKLEEQRQERQLQNLAARALTEGVPPRVPLDRPSGWALVPAEAFTMLGPQLHLVDLAVLTVCLHAFAGGAIPFKGGRWDDQGDAMLIPRKIQLKDARANVRPGGNTGAAIVTDLREVLEHLAANDLLEVTRTGGGWRLARGSRLKGTS